MKQQKEWLNCILQTRRIEMFQWKGEVVYKHPQTNSRNYRPVPLTSHCPHRKARYGNDWSYCTCSYISWHVTVLKWMLRTWKLNFMVHDGSKRGTVPYNDFCNWGKWQRQDIWTPYLSDEAVRGCVWGGAAIWTFETAFPLCILPLKHERERN